jgi:biotin-dependent carboxylase-like uncharacterized protein
VLSPGGARRLTVLRSGPQALVVDGGRPGLAHLGVPRSGALDLPAWALGNRLVGNEPGAAGLELLLGGLRVRAGDGCTVAVTGPPAPVWLTRGGRRRPVGGQCAVYLAAGDELEVGAPVGGVRCYLAVSGGLAVPETLGSRSTDLLSGLGPEPLTGGAELPLGEPAGPVPGDAGPVPVSVPPASPRVPVLLGPRDDWFTDPLAELRAGRWTVGERSNRIGLRLDGAALSRVPHRRGAELPSEPMVPGAVQVPPNGLPVIFLADGPTTGGYPVVAVVDPAALPALAQARPGSRLTISPRLPD